MNFPIRMIPRGEPLHSMRWASPALALALTVVSGFLIFAALGQNPFTALRTFFIEPLIGLRGWSELAVKATPLLLCSAGLVVCFRANVWNIGAEGQLVAGALAGGLAALSCGPETGRWYVIVVLAASAAGGAFWGSFTALLRHRFHANEILVSLMLVCRILQLVLSAKHLGYFFRSLIGKPLGHSRAINALQVSNGQYTFHDRRIRSKH